MEKNITSSIIIPVLNKWELTENCLRSLRDTLSDGVCEVIVIDNASSDETPLQCPALGKALFKENFIYHRADNNMNFGPASNHGARLARGDYLVFLNNDTVALPGWHERLLEDFSLYPDIAATGPLLMYPPLEPLGDTVQHLGVFINPKLQVGHLYEGIPASSPLAMKRRFFQIITAACMMIPKELFWRFGGFDERYINCFEDVDLCARMWSQGYRMTINPKARMYHLTSQTPGRHAHEEYNFLIFMRSVINLIVPDVNIYLQVDEYDLEMTPWLTLLPVKKRQDSPPVAEAVPHTSVVSLIRDPLDFKGYVSLAKELLAGGDAVKAMNILQPAIIKNFTPDLLLETLACAKSAKSTALEQQTIRLLANFCIPFERYQKSFGETVDWYEGIGLKDKVIWPSAWEGSGEKFRERYLNPFLAQMRDVLPPPAPSPEGCSPCNF